MMRFRKHLAAWALVLTVLSSGATAGPRVVGPGEPEGDDVRAAATALLLKVAKGDSEGARSLFAGGPEQAALLEAELRLVSSTAKLAEAMAKRFGNGSTGNVAMGQLFLDRAEMVGPRFIVVGQDAATVASGGVFDDGLELRRTGGAWRVTSLTNRPARAARLREFTDAINAAADEVREGVESGRITARQDATRVLNERIGAAMDKWIFPRPGPAGEPPAGIAAEALPAGAPLVPMPAGQALRGLLGQPLDSPLVQALVESMPGTPHIAQINKTLYVISNEAGISVSFGFDHAPRGRLGGVFVYAAGVDGNAAYTGPLPDGLSVTDRRRDAERKLGPPPRSSGGTHYQARYPGRELHIDYARPGARDADNPIRQVAIIAPKAPADAGGAANDNDAASGAQPAAAAGGPRVAFYLAAEPGERLADRDVLLVPDPNNSGRQLRLRRAPVLDETAIADVASMPKDKTFREWVVLLTLTPAGGRRLGEITAANRGRTLVILHDGRAILAAQIMAQLGEQVVIDTSARAADAGALDLADRLHAAIFRLDPATTRPSSGR